MRHTHTQANQKTLANTHRRTFRAKSKDALIKTPKRQSEEAHR